MGIEPVEIIEEQSVRSADEEERCRIWATLVNKFGAAEASRLWLAIFAATDAPKTG